MLYAAKSHIGLVRSMNQDGYVILSELPVGQLYLVADGMGGPSAGDVASQLAVQRVGEYMAANLLPTSDAPQVLVDAVHDANAAIFQQSCENPAYHGMGTTVVCALAVGDYIHIVHVGDSRAYVLVGDEFRQVTRDHSLVAELVRRGQLSEDEAKIHPQRNIVTRSLGTEPQSLPDLDSVAWRDGDVALLCSDGLTNLVSDSELAEYLRRARLCDNAGDLESLVDDMIEQALERGGTDNVTALVVVNREGADD
ncbi:Stp1/IreP family PP2C-type Ser/Thr phosphatase [Alicyclobacillus acidiphilus]|uniref:Stp1/IreP family PP2C-type Ser/Thr phosphatase n=1 Tax=Alicyclobacillus acidiphilus TaxID=182455 RepID=UPI0008298650|nr:Stp1/IreP family PP2C-type Ser/Thr phosphatase [Alicyclobacillus acidiphilus]